MKEVTELSKELEDEITSISQSIWDGLESAEEILRDHDHDIEIDNLETTGVADDDERWIVRFTVTVAIPKPE